jgi:hypothetical protein
MIATASRTARPLSRRLVRDTVARSIILWIGVRLAYAIVVGLSGQVAPDVRPLPLAGPVAAAIVVGFVGLLVRIDTRVCRETILIANLGVRPATIQMIAAGVASAFEVTVNVIASVQGA